MEVTGHGILDNMFYCPVGFFYGSGRALDRYLVIVLEGGMEMDF